MSGAYDAIFGSIARAKPISGFSARLGIGKHRVALKRYKVKPSEKNKGPILEADFTVVASTSHEVGETRGWAWFIGSQGWAGAYEEARAKDFIATIGKSIGDSRDVQSIGSELADESQPGMGIVLDVEIQPQTNRDGTPKLSAKQEVYTNAVWAPVAQDGAAIAQMRQTMEQLSQAQESRPQQPTQSMSTPAPTPSAGSTPLTALLTGLKR